MDEAEYLRFLQEEPENQVARREYFDWLATNHPSRSDFVRLMSERVQLKQKLAALEGAIEAHPIRADLKWLDTVFPLLVRAPSVGRFHLKPRLDAPPYVAVGTFVQPDTVLCLIEACGIFNEVVAGHSGTIAECFVEDGVTVDWNQRLFRLARPEQLREPATLDDWC